MFLLKRLRLREQRCQPLKKFTQKAPQPPALKPPSTARTAGRSDWAERRFRRQPFILLFVGASSIPLVSAESGENSLIPLRLLFPPNPLRWASAGALLSSANRPTCLRYAEGASHTARKNPLQSGFKSRSHKRRNVHFKGLRRVHAPPQPLNAHTAAHTGKQGVFRWWVLSLPSSCAARSGTSARAAVRRAFFAIFAWTEGTLERSREPSERRRALCASPFRGAAAPQGRAAPLLLLALHW